METLSEVDIVDYLALDIGGHERDVFSYYTLWAGKTKAVKACLGDDYHYNQAKDDLRNLGFNTWAMYNGICFYVLGEHDEVNSGNSASLRT
jgi:hypothetical protein